MCFPRRFTQYYLGISFRSTERTRLLYKTAKILLLYSSWTESLHCTSIIWSGVVIFLFLESLLCQILFCTLFFHKKNSSFEVSWVLQLKCQWRETLQCKNNWIPILIYFICKCIGGDNESSRYPWIPPGVIKGVTMASTRLVGEHNRTERVTSRTGAVGESRLALWIEMRYLNNADYSFANWLPVNVTPGR